MAKCEIMFPDELTVQLSELERNIDKVSEKCLQAGAEKVLPILKDCLSQSIGNDTRFESRSTGELFRSLGISPAKIGKDGNMNIKIGFNEPRTHQYKAACKRSYYTITNAMIANVLEYGKHGQPPKPFLKPAKRLAQKPVIAAMRRVFDEEVGKL